jgi:hypothetical protein
MRKKKPNISRIVLIAIGLIIAGLLFATKGMADDHRKAKGWFERKEQHYSPLFGRNDDEGNETAGQMAAWLLVAANLPVVLSLLIKWTNKFAPMGNGLKRCAGPVQPLPEEASHAIPLL